MARSRQRTERASRIEGRTVALVLLGTAVVVLYSLFVPLQTVLFDAPLPLSFILGAAVCGAPLLAVNRPRTAIAVFAVAAVASPLFVSIADAAASPWPWSVPALLSFVLLVAVVTFRHGARLGAFPLVIGSLASLALPLLRQDVLAPAGVAANVTANLIVTASVALATYLIAALTAGRLRVSEELTKEREHSALEESRRALVEERTRIARELHDVIAHSMSVIQVQASTARYRLPEIDPTAAEEFDSIAATARSSLTEMRRMLGVLRTEDQTADLSPQQRIDDIPALVDTIRRAGVTVGLEITGPVADAPSAVQIATYRIAQEALSNAVRHAHGAAVTVRVQADAARVGLRVRNARPATADEPRTGGHGLRGMRERVELLGGTFTASPTPDGGWEVSATLPITVPAVDATADTTADTEENP
ncbi:MULTISPECIES: sensor histidine kinase [unclassified Microbacterium]|uniref:sensor histidine kinase n=1 Tax=unclassified Microbacterium TaxID=2609290 RepID=UPI003424312F